MTQKQVAAKSGCELKEPVDEILDFVKNLRAADNVAHPSAEELKRMAERFGVRTVYGNYNFVSTVKNRSAWFTVSRARASSDNAIKQATLRPEIPEMAAIIRGILRDPVEWEEEPDFGTLIPRRTNGLQLTKFSLSNFYTEKVIKEYVLRLQKERIEWLKGIEGLQSYN